MIARLARIIGVLGFLFVFAVVDADPPTALAAGTLTLSPTHGSPGTTVTLTFVSSAPECFPGDTVQFKWNFVVWASAAVDVATCTAVTSAAARSGTPGNVTIRAYYNSIFQTSKIFTLEAAPATTVPATTSPPIVSPTTKPPTVPTAASQSGTSTTTILGATTTSSSSTSTSLAAAVTSDTTPSDGSAAAVPTDSNPPADGSTSSNSKPGSGGPPAKGVSNFVNSTPGPQQTTVVFAVVATNVLLTMLLLLLFGGTSAVFNSTLDSNRAVIEGWLTKARARIGGAAERFRFGSAVSPGLRVLIVVALSGIVYGFLSPAFTFDRAGIFLFLSMAVGITAVTYISKGGAILFSRHRLKVPIGFRVHSAALLSALACVAISRAIDFRPGLVYGFVASTVFLGAKLDRRQSGRVAFYPALFLLGLSVAAWIVLGWVRSGGSSSWVSQLLEAILAVLFVGGIEGVLFNMLPIAFLDGRAIIEWNRLAWLGLFGLSTFLFWQLLINPKDSYLDAIRETGVALVLSAALIYALITAAAWLYFRQLAKHAAVAGD